MDILPRIVLFGIIKKHGHSIIEDLKQLEAYLREYCFDCDREISALISTAKANVVSDLIIFGDGPQVKVLIDVLTKRLVARTALSETDARWAVLSWAFALEKITEKELAAIEEGEIEDEVKNPEVHEIKAVKDKPHIEIIIIYIAAAVIVIIAAAVFTGLLML